MRKLIWMLGAMALLAILVWWVSPERGTPKALAWLEPSQLAQDPGLFTRLKFRFLRLPGPFWGWYMSGREQIVVETRLLKLTAEATQRAEPSSLCWTNKDGVRAWILSPEDLKSLMQQLTGLAGVSLAKSFRFTTYDGGEAQLSDGSPAAATTNSIFVGLTISLLPKVVGGLFKLRVGANSTDTNSAPNGTTLGVTNLTASCQVLLSNGGGLVLDGGTNMVPHRTNDWIIISAVAVDAQGRPKRLRP